MRPRVVRLDDPEALDVPAVGAKAAGLARARRTGLPALDGFVVTLAASAEPLRLAAEELARRGSGAARMVLLRSELDEALAAEIAEAAAELAEPLIARSSSALEGEGTWAGAFASLPELRRHEVPKALRSVWSAMFTLEALERFEAVGIEPGSAGMGVLVQTELAPDCGGAATVDEIGAVSISAVKGSPRDLLAGWVPGVRATVGPDGSISGSEALELIGAATLGEVAALARQADAELDCNLVEWAVTGGAPVLLQVQRTVSAAASESMVLPAALGHPEARRLARLVMSYPGALGEELVLGWAAARVSADRAGGGGLSIGTRPAGDGPIGDTPGPTRSPGPGAAGQPFGGEGLGGLLVRARLVSAELTASAWGRPVEEASALARSVLRRLRGDRPNESIEALGGLAASDPVGAAEVLGIIERLGDALGDPHGVWYHSADELAEILGGTASLERGRVGRDRWEPFLAGVAALGGEARSGIGASGGVGAGRLVWVSSPTSVDHVRPRDVIVVQYPLPNFAPLLWDAAGLVALGGAPSAHLMEVARSLTVPAVVSCPVDDLFGTGASGRRGPDTPLHLGTVDGDEGRVAVLEL
ncbi:MAG: PEP-utilizing enzyme [bacterium]|nr:PEP-utilizing enzyme [bacterium]